MFISKIGFNQYNYFKNDNKKNYMTSFQGIKPDAFVKSNSQSKEVVKTLFIPVAAFAAAHGLSLNKVSTAAKNGELDIEGKNVNVEGSKTKDYLESLKQDEGNYITQADLAERLGISQPALSYHVSKGHLIATSKGIDLNDEKNKSFIESFKRRGDRVVDNKEVIKEQEVDVNENENHIAVVNFNHLNLKELANMLKMCNSVIRYHLFKGRLEKNEDKKYDLDSPLNQEFIKNADEHVKEVYASMTKEQLYKEIDNLKYLLKNRISEAVYVVSRDFQDEPKELKGYLKYSLKKIVNTESLTKEQFKKLLSIFEEIILDELKLESSANPKYYTSDEKLDLLAYKNLLEELVLRENGLKDDYKKLDVNEINISSEINEHIEKSAEEYAEQINTYNKLMSMNLDVLVDAYLYYEYISARSTYEKLTSFNKQISATGLSNIDEGKVSFYVRKVLKDARPFRKGEAIGYFQWKRFNKPKKAEDVVLDLIEQYRKLILSKICTTEILAKLQEENPGIEIYPQHLEDLVAEKLELD